MADPAEIIRQRPGPKGCRARFALMPDKPRHSVVGFTPHAWLQRLIAAAS
jgi:hypothetical protein